MPRELWTKTSGQSVELRSHFDPLFCPLVSPGKKTSDYALGAKLLFHSLRPARSKRQQMRPKFFS